MTAHPALLERHLSDIARAEIRQRDWKRMWIEGDRQKPFERKS